MKLSIKKLAQKALALAVSASMMLTLTPSAAWADDEVQLGVFKDNGNDTATSESTVKAEFNNVYASSFSMSPDAVCFGAKNQLQKFLEDEGFVATLTDAPAMTSATVEWYLYGASYGESGYKIDTSIEKFLLSEDYGSSDNPLSYGGVGNKDLLFTFPNYNNQTAGAGDSIDDAIAALMETVSSKGTYALRCVVISADDKDSQVEGVECSAFIVVNSAYKFEVYQAINVQTGTDDPNYAIAGNLFKEVGQVPELRVTPGITAGGDYDAITALARTNGETAETIGAEGASEFLVTGVTSPDDGLYYQGALNVFTDLPSELEETAQIGDEVTVYVYENNIAKTYTGTVCGPVDNDYTSSTYGETDDTWTNPADWVVHFVVTDTNDAPYSSIVAVGVPVDGTFTLKTVCGEGGAITPAYPTATKDIPLNTPITFTVQSVFPGYKFTGFELNFGTDPAIPIPDADKSFNSFKFNPLSDAYGVQDGDSVTVTAKFEKASETDTSKFTVNLSLSAANGALGDLTAFPGTLSGTSQLVNMGETKTLRNWSSKDGLYLQLNPKDENNSFLKSAEVVYSNGNTESITVSGTTYMIGYVPTNISAINIVYDTIRTPGDPVVSTGPYTVNAYLDANSQKRAQFDNVGENNKEFSQTVEQGESVTISLTALGNYVLKTVKINGTSYDPAHVCTINDKSAQLNLNSVIMDYDIEFGYKHGSTTITVTPGEGGDAEWIIDTSNSGQDGAAARTYGIAAHDMEESKSTTLSDEISRARLRIKVNKGYVLGTVKLAGITIDQSYFTKRVGDDGYDYYTITFAKADETGFVASDEGEWELGIGGQNNWTPADPGTPDKVWPVQGDSLDVVITYNSSFILAEQTYYSITTQVGTNGGGTVTPSARFAADTPADIWFYPDEGYMVNVVKVDGSVVAPGSSGSVCSLDSTGLHLVFDEGGKGLQGNHSVTVDFTRGSQDYGDVSSETVTINTSVMAGVGVVSPEGSVKVYKGSDCTFSLLPSTGYGLDYIMLDNSTTQIKTPGTNVDTTTDVNGQKVIVVNNVVTLENVQDNHSLVAYYKAIGTDVKPTYSVNVTVDNAGDSENSASPLGANVVAAGTDFQMNLLPHDGSKVTNLWVTAASSNNSVDMLHMVNNNELILQNVSDSYNIEVIYAKDEEATYDYNTFVIGDTNFKIGEGVLSISPDLATTVFMEEGTSGHATQGVDVTVTLASGYTLNSDGILVDGDAGKWSVTDNGNGVYLVHIDKELVVPGMGFEIGTQSSSATAVNPTLYKVTTKVIDGKGTINPSGNNNYIELERGKSQTFSFIPDEGYKLEQAYVGETPVNVTDNKYTINNIQSDMAISAVFSPLASGEQPQVPAEDIVKVSVSDASDPADVGKGKIDPLGNINVIKGASITVTAVPKEAGYIAHVYVGETAIPSNEITMAGCAATVNDITSFTNILVKFVKATSAKKLVVKEASGGQASPGGTTEFFTDSAVTQTVTLIPDERKAVGKVDVFTTGEDGTNSAVKSIDWANPDNNDSYITAVDAGSLSFAVTISAGKVTISPNFVDAGSSEAAKGPENKPLPTGDDIRGKGSQPEDAIPYAYVNATSVGGWGVVTQPDPNSVVIGKSITLAVTPLANSQITALTVNGTAISDAELEAVRASNVFTLDTSTISGLKDGDTINVEGTFARIATSAAAGYYPVITSVMGEGGSVYPGGSNGKGGKVDVLAGGTITLSIIPDPGYSLDKLIINDNPLDTSKIGYSYSLYDIDENKNVVISFKEDASVKDSPVTNKIVASSSVNGSISPSGTNLVVNGENAVFSFVPDAGCVLSYIKVDGIPYYSSSIKNMQYIFPNVDTSHTIHAVFITAEEAAGDNRGEASIMVGSVPNGTMSYQGTLISEQTPIPMFSNYTYAATEAPWFEICANYGYEVEHVYIGGVEISETAVVDKITTISGVEVEFTYQNGKVTLISTKGDTYITATLASDGSAPSGATGSEYVSLKGATSSTNGGSGSLSIGAGVDLLVDPTIDRETGSQLYTVSINPSEGDIAGEIVVTYGDGKAPEGYVVKYTETGVKAYQGDNEIALPDYVSDAGLMDVFDVYEQGYIDVNVIDAASAGKCTLFAEFRPMTDAEESAYTEPATYDIHIRWSGGGKVYPSKSMISVKCGSKQLIQMIPNNGYALSAVTVDGSRVSAHDIDNKCFDIDNNCYVFENVADNHTIEVSFAYTNPGNDTYTVKTHVDGDVGGTITADTEVPLGTAFEVQFMAWAPGHPDYNTGDKAYKVSQIKVGDSGWMDYTSPTYRVTSPREADAAVDVTVKFEELGAGETAPNYTYVQVTSEAAMGTGTITPASDMAIVGMPKTFYFKPGNDYGVSYVTFNGIRSNLSSTTTAFTVMPYADQENRLMVYFEKIQTQSDVTVDVDVTVEVEATASVNAGFKPQPATGAEGTVSPMTTTVPYDSSTTFYIFPNAGYTVASVADITDGADNPKALSWSPVSNEDDEVVEYNITDTEGSVEEVQVVGRAGSNQNTQTLSLASYGNAGYVGGAQATPAVFTGNMQLQTVADENKFNYSRSTDRFYNCYKVEVEGIKGDIDLMVDFVKIVDIAGFSTNTTFKRVETKIPTLTVTARNINTKFGVPASYEPVLPVQVPQNHKQIVKITNIFTGNYLQAVNLYAKNDDGNYVAIDHQDPMYNLIDIEKNSFEIMMGATDLQVELVFNTFDNTDVQYVNLGIGDCTVVDEAGNVIHDNIAGSFNDFQVGVSTANILNNPDSPKAFHLSQDNRGMMQYWNPTGGEDGSGGYEDYMFTQSLPNKDSFIDLYFAPYSIGGKQYVLKSVKFAGNEIYNDSLVENPGNLVQGIKLTQTGMFTLVYRELGKDETMATPLDTYNVTFKWEINGVEQTPKVPSEFTPWDPTRSVSVSVNPYDDAEKGLFYIPSEIELQWSSSEKVIVKPQEYVDGTYTLQPPIQSDVIVVIRLINCAYVTTSWDNEKGFITPNTVGTQVLKFGYSDDGDIEIKKNFTIAPYSGYDVKSATVAIEDSQPTSVIGQLKQSQAARDELVEMYKDEGTVEFDKPNNENAGVGVDGTNATANTQSTSTIDSAYAKTLAENNGSKPASTKFTRAYSYPMDISQLNSVALLAGEKYKYTLDVQFDELNNLGGGGGGSSSSSSSSSGGTSSSSSGGGSSSSKSAYTISTNADTVEHGSITPNSASVTVQAGGSQTFTFKPENDSYMVSSLLVDGKNVTASTTYTFTNVKEDHTLYVTFAAKSTVTEGADRLVRTLSSLAKTGDLTGPAVGALLLIAALGLGVTAFSYIRRNRRIRRKYAQSQSSSGE